MAYPFPPTRTRAPAPPREPFRVLNGAVYFDGRCDACRPFCGAVCCRGYSVVPLTEAEARSGRYAVKEADAECPCDTCSQMRALGVRYAVQKRDNGACFHLDAAGRCAVYHDRPATCREYSCVTTAFRILPLAPAGR